MKKYIYFFVMSGIFNVALAKSAVKELRVYKSERRLEIISTDDSLLKSYRIMLGRTPIGHKTQSGDNKTPEGTYTLDYKNPKSKFHKSFHISYPNSKDRAQAKARNVDPGGDIMLHGYPNNFLEMKDWLQTVNLDNMADEVIRSSLGLFDWTNGCIAVTNEEINEIYSIVDVPTKIVISP